MAPYSLEITCIRKGDRYNPFERITHVGGNGWRKTQEDVIRDIRFNRQPYHVTKRGIRVEVIAVQREGRWYLKTENDGVDPNNLLELPECI